MSRVYAISAVTANGRQLPTFYLFADVQGIMSEQQAAEVAARIVPPESNICAVETSCNAH